MNLSSEQDLIDFSESTRISNQLEHRFLQALAAKVKEELFWQTE